MTEQPIRNVMWVTGAYARANGSWPYSYLGVRHESGHRRQGTTGRKKHGVGEQMEHRGHEAETSWISGRAMPSDVAMNAI